MSVNIGDKIKIHYTAKSENGDLIENTSDNKPLIVEIGSKKLIPGLEEALIGLKKGDKRKITIPSNKGFGERKEDLLQEIPKSRFEEERINASEGNVIELKYDNGNRQLVTIHEVKEDTIVLDLNHPLAGETLTFDVEVVDISSK